MRLNTLCLVVVVAITAGCGSSSSEPDPGIVSNTARVGDPAVYARIDASTSCTELQREFDIASDNTTRIQADGGDATISISYMEAADVRMREIGCYG